MSEQSQIYMHIEKNGNRRLIGVPRGLMKKEEIISADENFPNNAPRTSAHF